MSKRKPIKKRLCPERMEKLAQIRGSKFRRPKNNYIWISKQEYRELFEVRKNKRLFFDIETSPNVVFSWRTGYNLNIGHDNIINERAIICISYKWEGEDVVNTLVWDKNQCDKKLLEKFVTIANEADELVAHNGDRYDIRWLRTRCLYHRIPAFPTYKSLDTLKKAKSRFSFNSNKLDYIAKFLGLGGKMDTGGFTLWTDIVLHKSKEALKKMVEYCERDVVLLEDVYRTLSPYIEHNTHMGVLNGGEKHSCPECGADESVLVKTIVTKAGTVQRLMHCPICDKVYKISNRDYQKKVLNV